MVNTFLGTRYEEALHPRYRGKWIEKPRVLLPEHAVSLVHDTKVSEITMDDVDKWLQKNAHYNHGVRKSDAQMSMEVISSFRDDKYGAWWLKQANEALRKVHTVMHGRPYDVANAKERIMVSQAVMDGDTDAIFPFPVYVSAGGDPNTVGLDVSKDGEFTMFEGNDEATPETLNLVNELLGNAERMITVWSSQPSDIAQRIRAGDIPRGIFVSPKREVAAGYWGEGRELVKFKLPLKRVAQHSEIDWQVRNRLTERDVLALRLAYNTAVGSKYQEVLHPRLKGKWRSKGAGVSPGAYPQSGPARPSAQSARKAAMADVQIKGGKLVLADGSPLPPHIARLRIPPAWTNIRVATDADAELLVRARDSKGRTQSLYSEAHKARVAAIKFARTRELLEKRDEITKENAHNRKAEDASIRENADVLMVIMSMGIRPGSVKDTQSATQAYGATTLEGRHIVADGANTRLRFTGKKGVALDLPVEDRDVAHLLRQRAEVAGTTGRLFATNSKSLLDYVKTLDGGGFKTKDFRTAVGTQTAIDDVRQAADLPQTKQEYVKRVRAVAKLVAARLGNTATVALQSYIDPTVFSAWRIEV
jgi:DNA topoisomerase-1